MSTTFWIKTLLWEIEEIAFQGNMTWIYFTNTIASMLPDNLKVIPLDNDSEDIHTIWDIKKEIKEESKMGKVRN